MITIIRTTLAVLAGLAILLPASSWPATAQDATPTMTYACEEAAASGAMGEMAGMMGMSTPMAGVDQMPMAFDQMYIDMMIPHHGSIIAMAQAALPRLTDERLNEIAEAVIATQTPEIEELRGYRADFYGEAEPMPMDAGMMTAMDEMMPGMSEEMAGMAFIMNAEAQAAAVCAAENTDLAFIDLTIPHHQMAIAASEAALQAATHPEIAGFAQRVIDAQQREIDEMTAIRQELTGAATPASS